MGWRFLTLLRYRHKTLQQVFDECGLSREAQAVLIANAGNFMCPPRDLSILAYNGLFSGYNRGAYYPRKHFKHLIDRLVEFITSHSGCHIYYEQEVTSMVAAGERIESVRTRDGKVFKAPTIICNADPQKMSKVIGLEKFPPPYRGPLNYEYSQTALTVYLGLRGIDLREHGFGRHNTWHLEQWDMNETWAQEMRQDWSRPWVFMATPSLHTDQPGTCPPGTQILELATTANYDYFRELRNRDLRAYRRQKKEVEDKLIDIVERRHVPNLRKHIVLHLAGSPTTNEDFCWAPRGHSYGQHLTPVNMGLGRLKADDTLGELLLVQRGKRLPRRQRHHRHGDGALHAAHRRSLLESARYAGHRHPAPSAVGALRKIANELRRHLRSAAARPFDPGRVHVVAAQVQSLAALPVA